MTWRTSETLESQHTLTLARRLSQRGYYSTLDVYIPSMRSASLPLPPLLNGTLPKSPCFSEHGAAYMHNVDIRLSQILVLSPLERVLISNMT